MNVRSRRGIMATCAFTFAAGVLAVTPALATQPGTVEGEFVENGHKVTICHRTGSESNPYVVITVDVAAIDGEGANDHDGHELVGNGPGGDIIPPVPGYNEDGKNWFWQWNPGDEVVATDCNPNQPS